MTDQMADSGVDRTREAYPGVKRELAFEPDVFAARIERTRARLAGAGLDALLVQHPSNVFYLTGYNTKVMFYSETLILPAKGQPRLAVLSWEVAAAHLTSAMAEIVTIPLLDDAAPVVAAQLDDLGLSRGRIGVELRSWNVTAHRYDALRRALPGAVLSDGSGIVEAEKVIKSPAEIEHIRAAAAISDHGIRAAVATARAGVTDNEIAGAIYNAIMREGGEYMSMDPVVVTGVRSSIMHASHHRVTVGNPDTIAIELGAVYQRYTAPLQRTIVVGTPSKDVERLTEASTAALENMLAVIRPGAAAADVLRAAEEGVRLAGDDVYFHKGAAYSIGAAFPPNWVEGSYYVGGMNPLALEGAPAIMAGMVLNLPMSLRYIGRVGVMQNEVVVVKESGCEALSRLPRRLLRAGETLPS